MQNSANMCSRVWLSGLVVVGAVLACSHAIQVVTEPAGQVTVAEGQQNVNLLCLVEEPVDFCMYVS